MIKKMYEIFIKIVAKVTRRFHPPGTQRIVRFLHNPATTKGIKTIVPFDKDLKIHVNTSNFIDWMVFFFGTYNLEIIKAIKKYLPKGGTFLDVGANIGTNTLIAAKIGIVIAVEPSNSHESLWDNCAINNFIPSVRMVKKPLSDKKKVVTFYEGSNNGNASFNPSHSNGEGIEMETTTIDDLLGGNPINLIKIDVQGYEGKVLKGGRKTIESHRPVIIFDYNEKLWKESREYFMEHLEYFYENDYRVHDLGNKESIICIPRK